MNSYLKTLTTGFGLLLVSFTIFAQNNDSDSTGVPGDNFDLQGALEMFKKAGSPEEFEKMINTESNNVNNLDLNGDGEIDYVKVIDKMDKDVHAFVLQVPVSETESQDIAVIELEKTGDESAMIQIVGDEEIYGEQVIVEPDSDGDNALINGWNQGNISGPAASLEPNKGIIVNVWLWPSVRFVYAPLYRPWISPWRWRHYPIWWRPWRPFAWHVWHPRCVVYHRAFVIVPTHRVVRAHKVYYPYRTTSVTVRTRHATAIGNYRVTRTRTTVTGPRGRKATKTTTTVTGKRGKVKATKTKVRRH
ncbi:MAG TPA: hypothetical protein PKC72_06360 [Chitinophagaceae bacterium]|nr:hypothetical protein [Chitinophagaceae bacterium]